MTSIFAGQPFKTRPFQTNSRVIWRIRVFARKFKLIKLCPGDRTSVCSMDHPWHWPAANCLVDWTSGYPPIKCWFFILISSSHEYSSARWFKPWPFHPLFGGHLTISKSHVVTVPNWSPADLPGVLFPNLWYCWWFRNPANHLGCKKPGK